MLIVFRVNLPYFSIDNAHPNIFVTFWYIFVCYDSYRLCNCMLIASVTMYFDLTCRVSIYLIDGMNVE
jgi:hypothetical protein